jgi:divalent metal cation (Fe/Co/Zn/Cd) transporter
MTDGRRPALIMIAHRLLIGTAVCFGIFYTVWEALAYRETTEVSHLVIAVISAVITLAMAYYLKNLRRFVSRLR